MTQPKVRSWVAVAAHQRSGAGTHGRRGKGRARKDKRSRQDIRKTLKEYR